MKYFMYILLGLFMLPACNNDFEEFNQDPFALTNDDLSADFRLVGEPFVNIIRSIYVHTPVWQTQLQQNLIGDAYSGYMMPPTPFAGNSNNMNYNIVDGWVTWAWNPAYQNVMAPALLVEQNAGEDFPEFLAWLKIIKVEAMHRVTDMWGAIIYTQFGEVSEDGLIAYDCQDVVYDAFFSDLQEGIDFLTEFNQTSGTQPFATFDEVYGGDIIKWVQFANSLRLRLAIRISDVDPNRARQEAEKSLSHPLGLIADNGGNFSIKNDVDHPLNTMSGSWNDARMGAPMESILGGYEDPRLPTFFNTALQENVQGQYKGIRQGIEIGDKGTYVNYSMLQPQGDVTLMVAAEVAFLKAEAALKGWNVNGNAQGHYEEGIRLSFQQYGLNGAEDYINSTAQPKPYVDINNTSNNIAEGSPYLSTAQIAWNSSDDNERKLEKIITQKWISMFPDGQEAWSEYRRTGYPVLFPVVINNSSGEVSTEEQIKRIKYISSEYTQNPKGVQSGISCLGGMDTAGVPLWWDVD